MGNLACEVCAGSLVKKEGMFVCQSCGLSYTIEEVKKMHAGTDADAKENIPEIKDDRAQRLENLRKLAERAQDNNDSVAAAKYYEQILMEDPDDWRANFYTTYYASHNTTIANIGEAARKVTNCLDSVLNLIEKQEELCIGAYAELALRVLQFKNMLVTNATNNAGTTQDSMKHCLNEWLTPTMEMSVALGEKLMYKKEGLEGAELALYGLEGDMKTMSEIVNSHPWMNAYGMKSIIKRYQNGIAEVKKLRKMKEETEKKKKMDEYWAQHAEEKQQLEIEKQQLTAELNQLSRQNNELEEKRRGLSSMKEKRDLELEIRDLTYKKDSLGIFKGKEKKELQAQIDKLSPQLDELKVRAQAEWEAASKEIDDVKERRKAVENLIGDIDKKLNCVEI